MQSNTRAPHPINVVQLQHRNTGWFLCSTENIMKLADVVCQCVLHLIGTVGMWGSKRTPCTAHFPVGAPYRLIQLWYYKRYLCYCATKL